MTNSTTPNSSGIDLRPSRTFITESVVQVDRSMGIYSKHIFPHILEWSLGTPEIGNYRRSTLAAARGETLEVGFGTGLNLPHYPETVTKLTAIDSENILQRRVERRIAESSIPVIRLQLDASGRMPFDDQRFDTIVTTMTLCSIADVAPALSEIARVMKPGGQYLFLEHGRSDDPSIARRQDRFNPLQRMIAAGCNINRSIDRLIKSAGFEIMSLDRFLMPNAPRIMAEMYRGVARLPGL
jgi:ubiquinone/menaquinone biosynthesis C-methylase UbiE